MLFSYESAVRECRRINESGGRSRPKKVWYGWIIVDIERVTNEKKLYN